MNKLFTGLSILGLVLVAACSGVRQLPVAQSPQVAKPRPPVPIIEADFPVPKDPSNRMMAFLVCIRGSYTGCVQAGAWLIEHAARGREMQVCLMPRDDIEPDPASRQCLDLTAEWPK